MKELGQMWVDKDKEAESKLIIKGKLLPEGEELKELRQMWVDMDREAQLLW